VHAAILEVPESGWKAYGKRTGCGSGMRRVVFVSNENWNRKGEPLRYVAIRLRSGREDYLLTAAACCTLPCSATFGTGAVKLIEWHRKSTAR